MPKRDRAAYMREYRARQRADDNDSADTGAPFDFQDVDLAFAIDEPPADDPDVVTLPVRLDDAHFAKLAAVMRAIEARHGSTVKAPAAMRVALDLAHRAIAASD